MRPDPTPQKRGGTLAAHALVAFAATMAFDLPPVPIPGHAAWADAFALLAVTAALVAWARGSSRIDRVSLLVGGAAISAAAYGAWAAATTLRLGIPGESGWKLLGLAELVSVFIVGQALFVAHGQPLADRVLRAWTWSVVALGSIGLVVGVLAQLGVNVSPLHRGDGDLGWAFRPAGLQRVGLLAELCLVPLILSFVDGERLLGSKRHAVRVILSVVLLATYTRTIVAAALAAAWSGTRRRGLRVAALIVLALAILVAARFDPHGRSESGMRWRIASAALHTAVAHPLWGVGPTGDVAVVSGPSDGDIPKPWDAHDTALDVAARYGVPGLCLLLCTALLVWRRSEEDSAMSRGLRFALVATAFDSFSVELADSRHVWLLMALAAARLGSRPAPRAPRPS